MVSKGPSAFAGRAPPGFTSKGVLEHVDKSPARGTLGLDALASDSGKFVATLCNELLGACDRWKAGNDPGGATWLNESAAESGHVCGMAAFAASTNMSTDGCVFATVAHAALGATWLMKDGWLMPHCCSFKAWLMQHD